MADFGMGVSLNLIDGFTANSQKILQNFNRLEGGIDKGGANIQNTLSDIGSAFAGAAAGFAIAAPFGVAIKSAMEFDAVMSDVAAKAGATSAEMKTLREEAIRLGDATVFSAVEAAKGQALLGQAGFSTQQIMTALPATLALASAGQLGLAEATDIAVGVMSGFRLKAEDIARVSDVLANGANKSTTSVQQIGEAMKYLAPTAATLKIPIEEATAAVQALANAGLTGSIATASLGNALAARLTDPSEKAAKAMANIQFRPFDNKGDFIGLNNMIELLSTNTKSLTSEQKLASLSTIFGAESLKQVLILMEQEAEVMKDGRLVTLKGAEALKFFTKENEKAGGSAEAMSKKMLDNLTGDVAMLGSATDTALIHIGSAFTDILRPAVQMLANLVAGINKMLGTELGRKLVVVAGGGALVVGAMTALGAILPVLKTGFVALRAAALAASTTMLPVVLAIGAVAAGAIIAYKAIEEFDAVMSGAGAQTGFTGFLQKTGGLIRGVMEIFETWNGQTFNISKTMEQSLKRIGMLDFFLTVSTYVVRGIELFRAFGNEVSLAFQQIKPAFVGAYEAFASLKNTVYELFPAFGKAMGGVELFSAAGKIMGQVFSFFVVKPLALVANGVWLVVTSIEAAIKAMGILKDVVSGDLSLSAGFEQIKGLGELYKKREIFIGEGAGPLLQPEKKTAPADLSGYQAQSSFFPMQGQGKTDKAMTASAGNEVTTAQKRALIFPTVQQEQAQNFTKEIMKSLVVEVNINDEKVAEAVNKVNDRNAGRQ